MQRATEVWMSQQTRRGSPRRRSESGVATVEFALVSIVFLMFLYGILTYGVVFMVKHDMAQAAAEGARAGLGAADPAAAAGLRVDSAIAGMPATFGAHLDTDIPPAAPCTHDPDNDCITVTLTYPYSDHPVIPALPFIGAAIP
ncbi:MAG: TadE/TadG family type IV pilus assembly protein, partial [Acidimicrobiia bacterium]